MVISYTKRLLRLLLGLFLFALGVYLTVQANIGLAPWEAFSMGFSIQTGIQFGDMVVITGLVIIILDFALREKIGFGTLLNAILIGKFMDIFAWIGIIPLMNRLGSGIAMLLFGQVIIAVGSFFYIGSGLGCGPRDALMVALGKRLTKAPIGLVRAGIEGSVLLVGWLMGAKVGIGTVIAVFGIGFIIQWTFKLLRFDVKAVQHENFADTVRAFKKPAAVEET